jgi:protein-tyrosine-phosphatase
VIALAAVFGTSFSVSSLALGRCRPRRVLFVCQFGTVKSPVAREHFRRRAAERGILVEAVARGITPQEHMSGDLRLALRKDGINVRADPLRPLAPVDARRADVLVFFDNLPPWIRTSDRRDWTDLPSMNSDYAAARSDLIGRIDRLLDEISTSADHRKRC